MKGYAGRKIGKSLGKNEGTIQSPGGDNDDR